MWAAHQSMSTVLERPFIMKPQARFLCLRSETVQKMNDRWRAWDVRSWGVELEPLATYEFSRLGELGQTEAVGGFSTPDCVFDFPEMIRNLQYAAIQRDSTILTDTSAEELIIKDNRVVGVVCQRNGKREMLDCDHCVIAMGAWSAELLRRHGITLPLVLWKCIVLSYPLELVPCLTVVLDVRESWAPDTALVPFKGTTLAAESEGVEAAGPNDKAIDPQRIERLRNELARCFPRISAFEPTPYVCFKTEYRTSTGTPDVGWHVYTAEERGIEGLTVALPGKASLVFELAAHVTKRIRELLPP